MTPRCCLPLLVALLALPAAARAQVPPEKALATFSVSDGLQLELFASEPLFVNPTCIDVDHKGRVWVCESVNYRSRLRNAPLRRKEGDRIVILEDADGDGKADSATTFYQAPELLAPLGIAVAKDPAGPGYKVYVCQSPDILVFEDKDGDGKADGPPKKLLTGFRGIDHDHGVHSVLIGPDLKLYFTVGDAGVDGLQSSDGKGRKWTSNSTDCRAGTVWRCDLDGTNLELLAHNFRNNYECCVDSFGTVFLSDNDDDGNQQTRICYVMPGGNYGYHPRGPGQTHWHEEQPGVVPKVLRTYFGSPTGICFYEGSLLPEKYRGHLLHCDAGPRHVRSYRVKPQGAGYELEREDIVQSTDNWFRPSDVCVAPDGSVFIADWYDPGVGGHGMGDTTRGRVYRLTPKGHKGYKVPAVKLETKEQIIEALASPCLANRTLAMAKLRAMEPDEAMVTLAVGMMTNPDRRVAVRCYWLLGILASKVEPEKRPKRVNGAFLQFMTAAGNEPGLEEHMPRINYSIFGPSGDRLKQAKLADLERDFAKRPPAYRREMLLTLRSEPPDAMKDWFYALAKLYDGKDRFYLCAVGIAVGTDPKRREVILADFEKHFPEWNDKVADLVWELRPPAMMPTLGKRLADASLPAAQRARIVDILAASDDPRAGLALLSVFKADLPAEVRAKAVDNLKLFLPGKWAALAHGPEVRAAVRDMLAKPETQPAGLALLPATRDPELLQKAVALAGNARAAFGARAAAVRAVGTWPAAEGAEAAALSDAIKALAGLAGAPQADLRKEAVQALGNLARQNTTAAAKEALHVLQGQVLAEKAAPDARREALEAVASARPGGRWLLNLHDNKELPEALRPEVARLLRNSPFPEVRARALVAFPPPGRLDPKKLPPIASLAARRGDAARGKQLLAESLKGDLQCLKCHTVRGTGGQIGPDLSVIGTKASRENLFESILYPSKAIADQYVTWQIETKNGQSILGLLVEETPTTLTLRDANGKDTKLDKKDIEGRAKSPKSIMPEDLVVFMTEDQLVDVVEYLFSLR